MNDTTTDRIPRRNEDLTWRDEDGDIFICSSDGESLYALTDVGADLWRECDGHNSLSDIELSLMSKYDVTQRILHADLDEFLKKLQKAGLIEID